jgi:hypothetical protein
MGMFIENSSYHIRPWEGKHELSITVWPIWDGKSGTGAGYKATGKDEKQSGKGSKIGKSPEPHGWTWVLLIMWRI